MSAACVITEGRHYDIDPDSGCWLWKLTRDRDGYGRVAPGALAHRRSYIEAGGELAPGQPLDHLCRNRACVNPAHLEPVTNAENTRRGLIARGYTGETCGEGHSLADAYIDPTTGRRRCRVCRRRYALAWYYRNRDRLQVAS